MTGNEGSRGREIYRLNQFNDRHASLTVLENITHQPLLDLA